MKAKKSTRTWLWAVVAAYTRFERFEAGRRQIATAMRLDPDNELIERALAELEDAGRAAAPGRH